MPRVTEATATNMVTQMRAAASRPRTNAVIYLAITLPKIFADIEAPDISDPDNPQLIQVPPKFAITFKDAPRWWEWTEPPPEIKLTPSELHNLTKWAAKLVVEEGL